jgi:hypothetical protein
MRKYLEVMDIVVTGPTNVTTKSHRYYSHTFNIRKYLDVTEFVVACPTYVNILKSRIL